ncbi:IS66 family insertion sequence element accessory protein TnpB [Microbulbifer sp. OS29]|uniref:IS66 family insertion sequence element accessory protein TnpB n=1 Tax=Microbulbifer okhotskensis TaxID=2926617 RepID=A0A9X2J8Q5_9GAMM|nr:IS66 family insertion sequence element accessory protein TnpB [Microbulbifer okhotskensis]MCO1335806.1 IS66 family insertion sequence element accessory protein TnpB [Microbulbifer okhotskensis]
MNTQSKAEFWQEHINAWNSSGLSQTAYCQQYQLKLSKQNKGRPKLIPISMPALQASVELTLPGGIQMQLPVSALEQLAA